MIKNKQGLSEKEYLTTYDIKAFEQPSVTVDILLFTMSEQAENNYRKLPKKSLKVLLIKRNEHPYIGKWAIPGGFVRMDENLETAAYRELKEETNVDKAYLEQLYTYGDVKRDPRGRIISTSFMSLVDKDEVNEKAGSDADEARWFEIDYKFLETKKEKTELGFNEYRYVKLTLTNGSDLLESVIKISKIVEGKHIKYKREIESNKNLSFDHGLIIQYGIERLRNKLEYTDIIFHLMTELFTLTELQKSYEEILDKHLLKANFRRKVAKFVIETDQSTSDAGHRPSKLFRFNPSWNE